MGCAAHHLTLDGPEVVHVENEQDREHEEGEVVGTLQAALRVEFLGEDGDYEELYHECHVQPHIEMGDEPHAHVVHLTADVRLQYHSGNNETALVASNLPIGLHCTRPIG